MPGTDSSGHSPSGDPGTAPPAGFALNVRALLGVAMLLGGLALLAAQVANRTSQAKESRQTRQRAIAEAEQHKPELLPAVSPADIEAAESANTAKVHVELPSSGQIVSFRVKKRRLGAGFDALCSIILDGVPPGALTLEQLQAMDMQYEDSDGDMLVLARASDMSAVAAEAQAIFVSKRYAKKPTCSRLNTAPKQIAVSVPTPSSPAPPADLMGT